MAIKTYFFIALVAALSSVTASVSPEDRGFMMTASNTFTMGKTESVCFTFHGVDEDMAVELSLIQNSQNVATKSYTFTKGNVNRCIDFPVPVVSQTSAQLQVKGSTTDSSINAPYKFMKTGDLTLKTNAAIVFIETDKQIYKPGQTVKFRIFSILPDLKPIKESLGEVWVNDPRGNRINQWRNTPTTLGLGDFELPMPADPILGSYTIHLKSNSMSESKTFKVEEYVLPKFEVTVELKPYFYVNDEIITGKVCAMYTYGKPVVGDVKIKFHLKNSFDQSSGHGLGVGGGFVPRRKGDILPTNIYSLSLQLNHCVDLSVAAAKVFGSNYLWNMNLVVSASVTERATGITQSGSGKSLLAMVRFKVNFANMPDFFKPGLPYSGKATLTRPDGTAAPSQKIEVSITGTKDIKFNREILTDSNGVFVVSLTSIPHTVEQISIVVVFREPQTSINSNRNMQNVRASKSVRNWFSKSGYAIQIMSIDDALERGSKQDVKVFYLTTSPSTMKFYYKVISKLGDMIKEDVVSHQSKASTRRKRDTAARPQNVESFNIELSVTSSMSGGVRLLVYTILPDGEVIADSHEFDVKDSLQNKVSVNFDKSKGLPGSPVDIELKATPESLCSLSVVDKSVYLLQAGDKLTPSKVFSALDALSIKPDLSDNCEDTSSTEKKEIFRGGMRSSNYYDSTKAFKDIGVVALTDLVLKTRLCSERPRIYFKNVVFDEEMAVGSKGPLKENTDIINKIDEPATGNQETVVDVRSYFPETWLFDLIKVESSGVATLKKEIPHTITLWVANAFCSNQEKGIGVSNVAKITGFQPFFVSFELPYSIIRGEKVPIQVSVFNYLSKCLVIDLALSLSENYDVEGATKASLCVCSNEQKVQEYFVVPKTLGKIDIRVDAVSSSNAIICGNQILAESLSEGASDSVVRKLLVEAEGTERSYSVSQLVCIGTSEPEPISLKLPDNVVDDSLRAQVVVVGDIMGPTLSGLDRLLTVPYGCGEQNMITFVPNIVVIKYLTTSNQLTPEIEQKAKTNMKKGYQRELNYRHKDGSYSAFGESDDSGSMWLSAFVVKSFAQSKPYIQIDEKNLDVTIEWFKSKQLDDGCFPQVGRVIHKDMKGGLGSGSSTVGISAFVLIAMLEAGIDKESSSVQSAVKCLSSKPVDKNDPYILALLAYAFSVYKPASAVAKEYLSTLTKLEINENGLIHWERPQQQKQDTSDKWMPHRQAASADVELTSYTLMALLNIGKITEGLAATLGKALPIVRWLTKQRNAQGGFSSTQDTVVALQSLAQYAANVFKTNTALTVTVEGNSFPRSSFTVNQNNRLLLQTKDIRKIPDELKVSTTGSGCALVQANVKFNIDKLQREEPAFNLEVQVNKLSSNKRKQNVHICASYNKADGVSNMAVVEAKMVSGWLPNKESVADLVRKTLKTGVKRFEIENNNVRLYFDELSHNKKCCTFQAEHDTDVERTRPGIAKVYDYYETALEVVNEFKVQEALPNVGGVGIVVPGLVVMYITVTSIILIRM